MNSTNHSKLFWGYSESVGEYSQLSSFRVVATGIAILLAFVLAYSAKTVSGSYYFKNSNGERIKELKEDTRFSRFAQSLKLSEDGKKLAGDCPFMIRNGQFRELVLTKPDHLRDFYRKDTKDHPKPRNLNLGEYFGRILGDAVGVKAGERWKIIRKYFDPEFSHSISTAAIPNFIEAISTWVDELPKESIASADGSFSKDVLRSCKFLPFRLVALKLYGDCFDEKLYSRLLEINSMHEKVIIDALFGKHLLSKIANIFPSAEKKRMDAYLVEWETFNLDVIRRARENNLSCPAERIYRGVDQAVEMTKNEFLHTLDEILFANVDISSAVINSLLTNLAANQPFQNSLRAEIAGKKKEQPYNVAQYIAKQDSLLNYLVMECMRLTPAFWFSLPECTAVEKDIGKYHIPANTAAVIDVRRLNTDPITWGSDGNVFRPERFAALSQTQCRYGFMRFGAGGGSGRCLGKNVADIVFKLTTLAILERYVLSPVTENGAAGNGSSEILFRRV